MENDIVDSKQRSNINICRYLYIYTYNTYGISNGSWLYIFNFITFIIVWRRIIVPLKCIIFH